MLCPSCGRDNPSDAQFCNECGGNLDTPVAETATPSEDSIPLYGSSTFVGRRQELADLKAALDGSLAGQGRLAMLVGEPGIGKTRTAQELAGYAAIRGTQVLWGRCYEEEGAPPYWPWLQSLRSYIQQQAPEQLQAEMGPGAAEIAQIVPEIRHKLTDLETPPVLEPEQARFRLFDSIITFLKNSAQSRPLLLVLDDLHWADKSSLLLLEFLAREIQSTPLLVLGTYRDVEVSRRHPLSETLGNLIREERFLRVQLPGLAEGEVEQLIQKTWTISPPPGLSVTIHQRTEGNPLFVGEIVATLSPDGLEKGQEHLTNIPEGVRDAIGRRLNRLSEDCNQVLTTASVVGREFEFKLLSGLNEEDTEDRVLGALEEALAAGVIEEPPGTAGRYQFTHALIQETLVQELSTTRRARLHARIGQGLEEMYGSNAEPHAAELAHHFAEAELVLGADKLVHYSMLAGERALASYAYEESQSHFQRALGALGVPLTMTEPAKDAQEAALLAGLGRAQLATLPRFQLSLAVASLGRAADYYVRSGDVAGAVAVAEQPIATMGLPTGMTQLIARVLPHVPPGSHAAGRTLCNYGRVLGLDEADYQGAQEAFRQALDIAQREGDSTLEARAQLGTFEVDIFHLRFRQAVEKGRWAIELSRNAGEPFAEARGLMWTCRVMLLAGDLEEARQHLSALLKLGEKLRDGHTLFQALFFNQQAHQMVGDWAAARDFHRRLIELTAKDMRHVCRRALLEYETGNFDEAQQYLELILEVMPLTPPGPNSGYALPALTIPAIARIRGAMDHLNVADAAAEAVVSASQVTPWIDSLARSGLALLAVLRQDRAVAMEQYAALEPRRGTLVAEGFLTVDRLLGLLAQTMGNLDQAASHFEDALAFSRKAGYRPELAWTCCDYAETLSQGNGDGDGGRSKAISLLDESLAISGELGMRPLMERVNVLKEKLASLPARAPAYPDGLTHREVEVLCLIAAGKTDREIAEELFISARTVGGHISNILNKTSTSNRAEAAAYATRRGLA